MAHSYGTTTAAFALTMGVHVDSFVTLGRPGCPGHRQGVTCMPEVFSGQAQDVWAIDPLVAINGRGRATSPSIP